MARRYSYSAVLALYHDLGWISLSDELCALYGASLTADQSPTPNPSRQYDPRLFGNQSRPWQASKPSNRRPDNWVAIDDSGPDFWSLTDDTTPADGRVTQIHSGSNSEAPEPGRVAVGHSGAHSDDTSFPSEDFGLDTGQNDGVRPSQTGREASSTPASSIDQVAEALGPGASQSRDRSLDMYEAIPQTESGPETGRRRPGARHATDIRNAPFLPDRDSVSSVATIVPLAPQNTRVIEDAPAPQQANTTRPRISTLSEQSTPRQSCEIGRRRNLQRAAEASASQPASKVLPDLPRKSNQRLTAAPTSRFAMPSNHHPQTMPPRARSSSRNRKQRPSSEEESLSSISDSVSETGVEIVDNVALSTGYDNGAKIPEHEAAAITRLPPPDAAVPACSIIPRQASPPPAVGFEVTKQIQAQPIIRTRSSRSSSRGGDALDATFPSGSSYTGESTYLPKANVVAPGALPESGVQRRANKNPFRGIPDLAPVGMPSIQPALPPQDPIKKSSSTVYNKPPPPVADEKTLAGRESFDHSFFPLSDAHAQDAKPRSVSEATDASSTAPSPPDILRTRQETAAVGRDSGMLFRQRRFSEVTKQDSAVAGMSGGSLSAASTRTFKGSKLLRRLRGVSLGGRG